VFDPRWQLAGRMAAGLAGALLLAGVIWQVCYTARWRLARWRGLRAIRQARDIAELAQTVRQFSLTGQATAPSLGEWQHRLAREAGTCDVAGAVRLLEQQLFGLASSNLDALQQSFLSALSRVRPKNMLPAPFGLERLMQA
jgi:hypothetical protein